MSNLFDAYAGFANRLQDLRGPNNGGYWSATCPLVRHSTARLRVWLGGDGRLLFGCYAGCDKKAILAALGLTWKDCYPAKEFVKPSRRRVTARFFYRDEAGKNLYWIERYEPGKNGAAKDFAYCRLLPDGRTAWNLDGCRRVLFRLPELLADCGSTVQVVEGEGKAELLASLGLLATTSPCGCGAWRDEYGEWLAGRDVAVWPDNNAAGRKYALAVTGTCVLWKARSVRVVELPGVPEGGDVKDWLRVNGAGLTDAERRRLLDSLWQGFARHGFLRPKADSHTTPLRT